MAHIRIPCLVARTNKAGITSWYWQPSKTLAQAGWKPLALGKDRAAAMAGAEARNAEVEQWKRGGVRPADIQRRRTAGTLSALIARYRAEVLQGKRPNGRPRIAARTAETYETSLARLEAWAGDQPLAFITPARVRVLRDRNLPLPADGGLGHAATFNLLKTLRQVMGFAERIDMISKGSNPATHFDLGAPEPRRQVWEAEDEAAFIAAAYDLGWPSLALAIELAIYTAQREGDLIGMTELQLRSLDIFDPMLRARLAGEDGTVMGWCLIQHKTGVPLDIPLEPRLWAKVAAALRTNRARDRAHGQLVSHVLVCDDTGRPWQKRQFIRSWRRVIDHAVVKTGRTHMQQLVWHDLRRTRVVRLRRQGMPKEMIAAITGTSAQSIDAMLRVYGPIDPTITAGAIAASLDHAARAAQ
jgi:hypothetical protein